MAKAAEAVRFLTAEEIFAVDDIQERTVLVPQWNGAVRIRTLTQKQAGDLRRRATRRDMVTKQDIIDNDRLEELLFIEGVSEPKFTSADYEKLQNKSMAAMQIILKAIMEASGLSDAAIKEATKSSEDEFDAEV